LTYETSVDIDTSGSFNNVPGSSAPEALAFWNTLTNNRICHLISLSSRVELDQRESKVARMLAEVMTIYQLRAAGKNPMDHQIVLGSRSVLIEQSSRYIAREASSTVDPGRQVGSIQVYERIIMVGYRHECCLFDESLMEALLDLWQVELEDKWPRASLLKSVIILYDQKTTELARVFGFDDAYEAFIDTGWPFVQERFGG
jgi:hypothetical protein